MSHKQAQGYVDLLGEVTTAPTGAAQWLTAQIGSTGFFLNWLQAAQNDFFQIKTQVNHNVGVANPLADIHVHYCLSSKPTAGQTVKLEIAYTWVPLGQPIPVIGSWSTATVTLTFTGAESADTHYIKALASNVAAPASNSYSSVVCFKCLRRSSGTGADTYGGNFGLFYVDMHVLADRPGSYLATADQ